MEAAGWGGRSGGEPGRNGSKACEPVCEVDDDIGKHPSTAERCGIGVGGGSLPLVGLSRAELVLAYSAENPVAAKQSGQYQEGLHSVVLTAERAWPGWAVPRLKQMPGQDGPSEADRRSGQVMSWHKA